MERYTLPSRGMNQCHGTLCSELNQRSAQVFAVVLELQIRAQDPLVQIDRHRALNFAPFQCTFSTS
jgi:hypothetical protein